MGTNPVTKISEESLKARALSLKQAYQTIGKNFNETLKHTDDDGSVFTFSKDPKTGEIKCTYYYHNEKVKDIMLFERATIATGKAGLAYLNKGQVEEYKRNHKNSYVTTEYVATDEKIKEKERLENLLNNYEKDTRKTARKEYKNLVQNELYLSGTVDKKNANKMAKYAKNDAQAGQNAKNTTVYLNKDEYKKAKRELEAEQKAAKKQIKEAREKGFLPNEAALAKMEENVKYIKDKDVRKYVKKNQDMFFVDGEFSSDKYHDWIKNHLQGDNTLTTGERKPASQATGLSGRDMKRAALTGGYDAQTDHTIWINIAKTAAGIAAPLVLAYMTNHNIHEVSKLQDTIEIYATNPDPDKFNEFISAISKAEGISEVTANFRNVAVRNAFFGALGPIIAGLWDPKAQRDKVSDAITASTITTQNVFRGKEVIHIEGQIPENTCDIGDTECNADIKKVTTEPTETKEDVVYEKSYFKETNERSHWYDFVQAYNFDHKKHSIKDIYRAIQRRNGYTAQNPNPPKNVMLPLELHDSQGNVIATRKDTYVIPRHKIPTGKGNGKGSAPGGTPKMSQTQGTNKWNVYGCDGKLVESYNNLEDAKNKYTDITGKEFSGTF